MGLPGFLIGSAGVGGDGDGSCCGGVDYSIGVLVWWFCGLDFGLGGCGGFVVLLFEPHSVYKILMATCAHHTPHIY